MTKAMADSAGRIKPVASSHSDTLFHWNSKVCQYRKSLANVAINKVLPAATKPGGISLRRPENSSRLMSATSEGTPGIRERALVSASWGTYARAHRRHSNANGL